jgi:hypothetical protein
MIDITSTNTTLADAFPRFNKRAIKIYMHWQSDWAHWPDCWGRSGVQPQSFMRPFVALSAECGIDEKSVRMIFHEYVQELEQIRPRLTPVVMGMDELYLLSQPRGVITDLKGRTIIEILTDRKKQSIV